MKFYIYTLSDPLTKEVRCMGKTNDIESQLKEFTSEQYIKESWSLKAKWIKQLSLKKLKPIIEILDSAEKEHIDNLELYWQSQFKTWGYKLIN